MNESRQKKSEMLGVRLPHPTKSAFMAKARAEGRPASEIVRDSIERYLVGSRHCGSALAHSSVAMFDRSSH
jgi:hypothetical protein